MVAKTLGTIKKVQQQPPLAIEWKPAPLPRGALPMKPKILLANYAMIVAGWKCVHCNVLPPTRVVPFPSDVPVAGPSTAKQSFSANERLRLKQRPPDSTVLPLLSRDERKLRLLELLKILRVCPQLQRAENRGCFNCSEPHHHRECPYRRGTFCGRCGEPGMVHDECPRCYPEKYQLKGVVPKPTIRRG